MRILIVIILMLLAALAHGQTHTMPGSNVVPSGASLTINSGASITAAAGSTVTGFGSGGGGGTPGGSNTQVQFNDSSAFGGDSGLIWDKTNDILSLPGFLTTDSKLKVGSLEFQTYGLGNGWLGENIYFDGTNFKYRTTGPGSILFFGGNEMTLATALSGTGGTIVGTALKNQFKINANGSAGLGGNQNGGSGIFTNSLFFLNGSATQIGIASNYELGWSGTSGDAAATMDTGLGRNAAGVVEVNNGTAGTFRDLKARTVNATTGFQLNGVEFPTASNGLVKRTAANTYAAAASGTDYAPATSGSSILYGNGSGGFSNVTVGTGLSFTTGTLAATGAVAAPLTLTLSDAVTNLVSDVLTISHNSTGTAADAFGTGLLFQGESSSTDNTIMGEVAARWKTASHSTRSSYLVLSGGSNTGVSGSKVFVGSAGGIAVGYGSYVEPSGSVDISSEGVKIGSVGPSGEVLMGNGTYFTRSGYTFPVSIGGIGKILQSNNTNTVFSTPTWPTTAGTAGYTVRSDGTNLGMYPQDMLNSSVSTQTPISTSDVYMTGSNVVVAAGDVKAKGQYRCLFDMTKSAGTGAIVISLRVGTAGTTSDPAILTFTFTAGTSVADTGTFEIIATWRTVGSGTSAVMQGICRANKNTATAAGLWGVANDSQTIVATTSSGFNSSTATNIGVSFNGSTAFSGTTTLVQASLLQ